MDTIAARRPQTATNFPLPPADLESLGFRRQQIDRLVALIERHIAEGRYPGCQIALARHGKLALYKSFGDAVTEPKARAAADDTLWLLYSNTKVVTAVTLWALAERGLFSFSDRIADHVPDFRKHAKGNITVLQTITHQAGFPNAVVTKDAWTNHKRLRDVVCDFPLEWSPGSKVHYHGLSALGSTNTWACPCIAASAPTSVARPRTSAGSAALPTRACSATAASARRTAGAIPSRACRSPTSPTTASPIPGTASGSTLSPTSSIRRLSSG